MPDRYSVVPDACALVDSSIVKRYTGADIKGKPGSSARTDLENFTECDWVNIKGELGTKGALNIVLQLWHTYLGDSGAQWAASEPISSLGRLSGSVVLQDGDGFDQVAGLAGAAAQFSEDSPCFELGVRAFTGATELGM